MKNIFFLFGILIIVIGAVIFSDSITFSFRRTPTVTTKNMTFKVSLAKTSQEKQIGLSKENSLAQDQGMLFIFEKPDYYSFWMKNMKFPLDILFIRDNTVVTIFTDVQTPLPTDETLPVYTPEEPADKVLEVNAGSIEKYHIKKGDEVTILQ